MRLFYQIVVLLFPFAAQTQSQYPFGVLYEELNAKLAVRNAKSLGIKGKVRSFTETLHFAGADTQRLPFPRSSITTYYEFTPDGLLISLTRGDSSNLAGHSLAHYEIFKYHAQTRLLEEITINNASSEYISEYRHKFNKYGFQDSSQNKFQYKNQSSQSYNSNYTSFYTYHNNFSEVATRVMYSRKPAHNTERNSRWRFVFNKQGKLIAETCLEGNYFSTVIQYNNKSGLPVWINKSTAPDSFGYCMYNITHLVYDARGRKVYEEVNQNTSKTARVFDYCYKYGYDNENRTISMQTEVGDYDKNYGGLQFYRQEPIRFFEYLNDEQGNWIEMKEFSLYPKTEKSLISVTKRAINYYR